MDPMRKIDHPLYGTWWAMRLRCSNPKDPSYQWYGAKGVAVCEGWINDFWLFVSDVGEKPTARHTLDRFPNMSGNYEPGNVRWATPQEQARNKDYSSIVQSARIRNPGMPKLKPTNKDERAYYALLLPPPAGHG